LLPGGEVKHIHSTGELFTNEQGVAQKMIGTIQDITQQVLARQALEKSEKRLKRAQQIGKTGYWEWDIVTDEVYWSDELYLLYEMDKESFVPSIGSVVEMMYEKDRQRITEYIYSCLAQKQTHYQIEGPALTSKGNRVYFLAKAEIIYDAAGNAVRMEGVSHDITGLKKAEEDLRFKEYLLQNVNDAIISTDGQMCITSWNKAAGKIYGHTETEALGKNLTDLLGFTPPASDSQEHADFLEKGYFKGELTMKRKDGSQVTIEAHTIALMDEKGEFTGRVSVDRDITAYKQMQNKVYESEAMLKLVINTVPQAIFWKDLNAIYRGCNQNFIRMFRLRDAEQLIGKNDKQMYWGQELAAELLHQDQQIMQGKIPRLFYTKTIEAADKSLIWLEVKLVPLYNKEEQIIGVLGTAEDITEKKSIEQALIQSKANLEAIIENTDDLIWALNKEFKMIAMNSNLARFWKQFFDSTLQVGDSCFDIQPLWAQERWVQVHRKVLSGEKVFVTKRYRLNDAHHWFDIACFPIVEAGGKITGASYIVRDVTQRKKQEKLLLQYVKRHSQLSLEQEKQKMMAVIKGQEEERRLISMELHDGVGQMLTALNFRMNKITDKLYPQVTPDLSLSLQEVVKLQKSIYQEVRRISENLMPQFLNDFPLEQALEQLINQSFGNTGIRVDSEIELQGYTFEKSIEIALFRMAQEIFNNILKHSQATVVSVTMHVKKAGLFFLIKDNGLGFDLSATHHKMGKGLNNIRQRVSLLNGSFVVASHPGEGFQLQIKIPVSSYEKN
jgi:PAS domain S-box-containing protein